MTKLKSGNNSNSLGSQLSFGDSDEYIHDTIVVGNRTPTVRHSDHSDRNMLRPFISWDGEGYTDSWGNHHYWLLANSVGDKIIAPPGRTIERWNMARLFHTAQRTYPTAIHTGFALGYDFTMLLRANGLTPDERESLSKKQYMVSEGFMWKVMMGKQLTVYPTVDSSNREFAGNSHKFNLQDSWGFFQRSLVKALDEYFPDGWPGVSTEDREYLIEMKANRSTFTRDEDVNVQKYCDMELALHVELMEDLRDRLFESGMPVSRWYGPGAIANGLLKRWRIDSKIRNLYHEKPNLAAVAQHAYAGGRFELVKPGHINGPVYQYDVNSAYPHALSNLPNLADGEWVHHVEPDPFSLPPVSVVRIRWRTGVDFSSVRSASCMEEGYPLSIPFPFWRRTPDRNIHFPSTGVHGWYWLPELLAGINYSNSLPDFYHASYVVEEAYSYYPATDEQPYSVIKDLYALRQQLKAKGNGAHIGLKLGLNSLYGKFCQQVGYDESTGKIPTYHNLVIGGMITATCRGMMLDATKLDPNAIIAYETDGVFSTRPLPLPVSTDLGGWDYTRYDDMWYLQSGFRFGIRDGEVIKSATRGIPARDVSLGAIQSAIRGPESALPIQHTQFITLAQAYAWNKPHLAGQWKTSPRQLSVMLENFHGKRIHEPDCPSCSKDDEGMRSYNWEHPHLTIPARGYEGMLSEPHKVLWNAEDRTTMESDVTLWDDELLIEP